MLEQMDPDRIRLANKHVLLGSEFVPDPLVSMKSRKSNKAGENTNGGVNKASSSQMKLQETCAQALVEMFEAGLKEDIRLYLKSAYRSYQTQKTMYYNRLKRNNGRDDGWVNMPGASDHQTGLGCDIVSRSWRDKAMNRDFAKTKEAQWMVENAAAGETMEKVLFNPSTSLMTGVRSADDEASSKCQIEFCAALLYKPTKPL